MSRGQQLLVPTKGGGILSYPDKVLASDPLRYWPLWDLAGLAATELVVGDDGTYTGVTLADALAPDGSPSPRFDGANDYVSCFSLALQAAFNGSEGSMFAFGQVFNAAVWADGVIRFINIYVVDVNNRVRTFKRDPNQISASYTAGGVAEDIDQAGMAGRVTWFHWGCTWSRSAGINGEFRAYLDGLQSGATQVALGNWVGLLNPAVGGAVIGAFNLAPVLAWNGWISHVILYDRALPPAEVLDLATA